MQIGELAQRTGISRRSLRYYEQQGLLHARRANNGWRDYEEAAVIRARNVRELLDAGLSVADIREVGGCLERDLAATVPCGQAAQIYARRLARLDDRIAVLQQHRAQLLERMDELLDAIGEHASDHAALAGASEGSAR